MTIALSTLVDPEHGLVSPEIFANQEVFDLEQRRLFMRTWVFVGHESMIPKRGDFVSTYIGLNPVLVVRQGDGGIKVLLNACRHRGMKVCRADNGTERSFTCAFHGWAYGLDGELVSVPYLEDGYRGKLDTKAYGLISVPRVETYKGLIFANFLESAPTLLEYLGEMAWYLDGVLDRREGGTQVMGGVHKIRHAGNWKMGSEQFAGDNYHAFITHMSAMEAINGQNPNGVAWAMVEGNQLATTSGHGIAGWRLAGVEKQPTLPTADFELVARYYRDTAKEVANRIGEERAAGPSLGAHTVFPNFSYLTRVFNQTSIGVWHPKAPNSFEYWRYCLVDAAAPEDVKHAQVRLMHVWPLGIADADDGENWSEIGANLSAPAVRDVMLNYQMGMGESRHDDPAFPGIINPHYIGEESHRYYYRRWQEFMECEDGYPQLNPPIAYTN